MSARVCPIKGCTNPVHGRGLCNNHLARQRTLGDPVAPLRSRAPGHGPTHPQWVGDAASIQAIRDRVRAARGSATGQRCHNCERDAFGWQSGGDDPLDVTTYVPRCRRCILVGGKA